MRSKLLLLAAAATGLSACHSPAAQAEEEYDRASKLGMDQAEICQTAERARDAWRADGDDTKYRQWSVTAFNACTKAAR